MAIIEEVFTTFEPVFELEFVEELEIVEEQKKQKSKIKKQKSSCLLKSVSLMVILTFLL